MNFRNFLFSGFASLSIITLIPLQFAAAALPTGAVKLGSDKLFTSGKVACGKISGKWVPGSRLSKGYFITHSKYSSYYKKLAGKASGRTKKSLTTKSKQYGARAKSEAAVCAPGPVVPAPVSQKLAFNLTGAVGIVMRDAMISSLETKDVNAFDAPTSNLQKVDSNGTLTSILASGKANINKFLIAPSDKLYVLFQNKTNLENTSDTSGTGCLLAEVDKGNGNPTCIESQATSVPWFSSEGRNPSIQFDASGAVYYLATDVTTKLRKYSNGVVTDLINDNISVSNFLVLPDGRVILGGMTNSSSASWVRRLNPNGGLTNLYANRSSYFITEFPDGNIYMGIAPLPGWSVVRYLPGSDAADPSPWIGYYSEGGPYPIPHNNQRDVCDGNNQTTLYSFCGYGGAHVKNIFRTLDGKMIAISGSGAQGTLMQYYPTVTPLSTTVQNISIGQSVISSIILAGVDADGKNVMTIYNTTDQSEAAVITAANETEIYHLNFAAAQNKIFFDGLRFSDNKYVIGHVNLNTLEVVSAATGTTKLVDFQTFQ